MKRTDREFLHDNYLTVGEMERILLDHLDGKRASIPPPHSRARTLVTLMIDRGWLERHTRTATGILCYPQSSITEDGRGVLARLLAEHADRLTYAHLKVSDAKESAMLAAALAHASPPYRTPSDPTSPQS